MRHLSPRSHSRSRPTQRPERAFTLVEVTLAFGIAVTALLVVISLIPLGLASLQDSGRQIVETEIYNKIGSELAATAIYDDSSSPARQNVLTSQYCNDTVRFPAYFDAEGNELIKSGGGIPAQTVFTVRCIPGSATGESDPVANAWKKAGTGELVSATVKIGFHLDPNSTKASPTNVRKRTFLLSNHGS